MLKILSASSNKRVKKAVKWWNSPYRSLFIQVGWQQNYDPVSNRYGVGPKIETPLEIIERREENSIRSQRTAILYSCISDLGARRESIIKDIIAYLGNGAKGIPSVSEIAQRIGLEEKEIKKILISLLIQRHTLYPNVQTYSFKYTLIVSAIS